MSEKNRTVKLVDGVWLGHIHRAATLFKLSYITMDVWQNMAENYGNGNMAQHLVHLFRGFFNDMFSGFPEGYYLEITPIMFLTPLSLGRVC